MTNPHGLPAELERAPRSAGAVTRSRESCGGRTASRRPARRRAPNINEPALFTALVKRHTPPVVAKSVIDRVARGGNVPVLVPIVEDERALNADISACGVSVEQVSRTSL
jgi:hypothetical protein